MLLMVSSIILCMLYTMFFVRYSLINIKYVYIFMPLYILESSEIIW